MLLPFRCIVFLLILVIGAFITKKELSGISNWWSIIASCVNIVTILILLYVAKKMVGHTIIDIATVMQILATSAVPELYDMMCNM